MRKIILMIGLLLLVGCASDQSGEQGVTIFGRLSQLVQLGSTEETIAYKLQTESYFVTIRAEVLQANPASLDIAITDRRTGAVRDDVTVDVLLCHAVDEEIWRLGGCENNGYAGALYRHELTTTFDNGVYRADGFSWERAAGWDGTLTIVDGDSTETLLISPNVYPPRPASTNTFELVSISLPFIVIAIFLAAIMLFRGRLMQSTPRVASN